MKFCLNYDINNARDYDRKKNELLCVIKRFMPTPNHVREETESSLLITFNQNVEGFIEHLDEHLECEYFVCMIAVDRFNRDIMVSSTDRTSDDRFQERYTNLRC